MRFLIRSAAIAFFAISLSGCVLSTAEIRPQLEHVENPISTKTVFIESVVDVRQFELAPKQPSEPSVEYKKDLSNKKLLAQAIGRKRDGFGRAVGMVLLPQDVAVTDVFRDVVSNAFKQNGYRVLTVTDPGYESARHVSVKINKYWSWFYTPFTAPSLACHVEAEIKTSLNGFENGIIITGDATNPRASEREKYWVDITSAGLSDFNKNLTNTIQRSEK